MILFGFTIIFMQFDLDDTPVSSFGKYMLITYRLTFSDFEVDDFDSGQSFFMVIITILLSVILFNMLVAIMTDSFEKVQENAIISESRERLFLITEAIAVKKLVIKLCRRRKRLNPEYEVIEPERRYLFVAEEAGVDEDANKDNKEWEGRLQVIKKSIKSNEDNMKSALRGFEVKIEKDFDDLRFDAGTLELKMRKLDGRIARIETFLTKQHESAMNNDSPYAPES